MRQIIDAAVWGSCGLMALASLPGCGWAQVVHGAQGDTRGKEAARMANGFDQTAAPIPTPMHPALPTVNLGDTGFLDGVAGPGLLLEEFADGYHADHIRNAQGVPLPMAGGLYSIAGITHVAYLSRTRLLGAWYGVEFVQAVAHANVNPTVHATGASDLTVAPFILQWKQRQFGPVHAAQRVVFDLDLPTGEYTAASPVSLSSHAFAVNPYYAVTLLASKRLETSWRVHYLWNGVNRAPSTMEGAESTQAGQAVHFNATVGYRASGALWLGANGYLLKQISNPQVNGHTLTASPEQVGAIGPGAVWDLRKLLLYANAHHEVGALNHPQGNRVVLRLQWVPGRR